MPGFFAASFAIAGVAAAAATVLMHLLNRRRHRTIAWAAMDFLREATLRTRRMIRLRDLLLLLLRVAAVLGFGLALARPYYESGEQSTPPNQPVHAVFVIDNSLSMTGEETSGTLLELAGQRAAELIEQFPDESRVSIIPLCGPADRIEREAFRSRQEARDAIDRLEYVDRTETAAFAIPLVQEALGHAPELPNKRVYLISDQQKVVWPVSAQEAVAKALPELQVIPVESARLDNAWVADVELEDGFAEPRMPTSIKATIRYTGSAPRNNVAVMLRIDDATVATQYVDLVPGQTREVQFLHEFTAADDAGRVAQVPVTVSLSNDRLPADDLRTLIVPVVASLPVVFVDQFGSRGEAPGRNRLGETYYVRQLLAPTDPSDPAKRRGLTIRYLTIDELTQTVLQDARLVVVAGIESPGKAVGLLRDYVEQGGQLLIAAGGDFSPSAWSREAWDDGHGILPVPLQPNLLGKLPKTAGTDLAPLFLDPATMTDEPFQIPGAARDDLEELFRTPVFFMSVVPSSLTPEITPPPRQVDTDPARSDSNPERQASRWLQWRPERSAEPATPDSENHPDAAPPRVVASFSNGNPFLIERRIGAGTVLLATSGIGSDWNNLPRTNAVLILDRILREMLKRGLPRRTVETVAALDVPLPIVDRRMQFECRRPDGTIEAVAVEALGPNEFGIVLRNLTRRGIYRLTAVPDQSSVQSPAASLPPVTELVFAVNGPEAESDLTPIDPDELKRHFRLDEGSGPETTNAVQFSGPGGSQHDLWRWLLWGVLVCLILETVCLLLLNPAARRINSPAGG